MMKTASRRKPGIVTRIVLLLVAFLINVALGLACILPWDISYFYGYSTLRGDEAKAWVRTRSNLRDSGRLEIVEVDRYFSLGMQWSVALGGLEDGTDVYVEDIVVGLPFLAFSGEWSMIGTQKNSTGLIFPPFTIRDAPVLVPFRPRIFGSIANTLLFYLLLLLLRRGVLRLRKRWRLRRNECPDCGYPKMDAVSYQCPECGWNR